MGMLFGAALSPLGCDDGGSRAASSTASPPRRSAAMLRTVHRALRDGDRTAYRALFVAAAEDGAELCPGQSPPAADIDGSFAACHAEGPWERTKAGIRSRKHDGLNEDDRRCGDVAGCPGLERLCKSELYAYDPKGVAELMISLSGVVRRKRDGALFLHRPPRCSRKDRRN